jgi:peptide/nickel transport system permease protein
VLSIGDSEYVQSARLLGVSSRKTLFRDVLPNVAGPVLVLATLDLGTAILLLAGLSFLGLGAQPPDPEWGSMVATGTQYFEQWWIGTFPGLAIFTAVVAFNFLGDSLRDFFDPTSAGADRGR